MSSTSRPRPDGLDLTFRRMRFDFEDGFDRYWHGGSAFRSLFWTQLSTAFQPGERFFIDSARALRHELDDPALLHELAVFCRQEGHHTAQHLKFDRMNEAHGIDVGACRARYAFWLGLGRRMGPHYMLGVTCALEHFTSGLADLWYRRPDLSEGGDPRVLALWNWHAAEEAEHRGTCFDIYEAVGASYLTRVRTLISAWLLIISISVVNTLTLLRQDGRLFTWDTVVGLWSLFGWRGYVVSLIPAALRYLSPTFHPWTSEVEVGPEEIAAWQARNHRYIVSLDPGGAAPRSEAPAGLVPAT